MKAAMNAESVYYRLARQLDRFPHGFPATDSGVELRILERIFSPEDAELTLQLKMVPESAAAVAHRLGRSIDETRAILDRMAAAGQIFSFTMRGRQRYMQAPFIVGIYEFQLPRMDTELAELFEEYAPTLLSTLGGSGPPLARVIPVNRTLAATAQVLRHESVREMLERARSFRVMDCICRMEKAALGSPCRHPTETCLSFSPDEDAYRGFPPWGRSVSREEALEILHQAEEEGLIHCTYNLASQNMFVCNCCACCCGFLRGLKEFEAPHLLVRSNFVAVIDRALCIACGDCADERCPMEAISEAADGYVVDPARCIGCGVCALPCPSDAVTLQQRPVAECTMPPKNLVRWSFDRAVQRSGPVRALLQFGGLGLDAYRAKRFADD